MPPCACAPIAPQPDLLAAAVALLPPGLHRLEIHNSRCSGPLLGLVGQRFTQLQRRVLPGNAAQLNWGARGTSAAVRLLEKLQLTYSWPTYEYNGGDIDRSFDCCALPDSDLAALRHAARLHKLDLSAECSLGLVHLLGSVRSLRALRCGAGWVLAVMHKGLAASTRLTPFWIPR